MEDIEVDFKLILIIIFIAFLLGGIIWLGYDFYMNSSQDENEGIQYFQGADTSSIDSIDINETDKNNTELNMNDILGEDGFQINNYNTEPKKENWVKRINNFIEAGHRTMYYIPNDWGRDVIRDEKNNTKIGVKILKINDLTEETTYQEFLNKFIETKEQKEFSPQEVKNYTQRTANINGKNFDILIENEYYNSVYEYFCLAKDGYAFYMEVSTLKQNYNQELIETINEIYETFRIMN